MIIDLRDYTTTLEGRDLLIERCETLLFPEQERLGATFHGIFRDAEHPDRFVWLRSTADMAARLRLLTSFYSDGALWRAHRAEVNSWIVDSDNVLLMEPISPWAAPASGASVVAMYTHLRREPLTDAVALEQAVQAGIRAAGGRLLVTLATNPATNNYPRHPIRTGEYGCVWFATYPPAHYRSLGLAALETRYLLPTARSWLR
jgi:hypothetical protein